jgi:23S rRNA (adenine2503-C2)-methyltransferase
MEIASAFGLAMTTQQHSIYDLTPSELAVWLVKHSQPGYRARQVYEALYQKGQPDPASWTTLPKPMRDELASEFPTPGLSLIQQQTSSDGTAKWLWKLPDGQSVETVMIPADGRRTVCVSTQVGCAYRCGFCASGMQGFFRDLTAGEIVQQVALVDRALKPDRVSNIVFMGMGEPLSNYENLIRAIRIINSPDGLKVGARKITISTVGLIPMMERLAKEGLQLELAVSLHAPNDGIRGKLMPVNKRYPMVRLLAACRAFVKATKRLITFEYILIDGLNDQPQHAEELAGRLKGLLCKVNLIPCHPIPGTPWGRPPEERMLAFEKKLKEKGIACTLRQSRGLDIEGACGQLRLRHETPTEVK